MKKPAPKAAVAKTVIKPKAKAKAKPVANGKVVTLNPYINRETSWLHFNERVLEEAKNPKNPLLERARFLSIFESNLDEFYMVRVSGLIEQFESGVLDPSPDGLTPNEQLQLISKQAEPLRQQASDTWEEIHSKLNEHGVQILTLGQLSGPKAATMDEYFMNEVFHVCTPLILDPAESVPFISNRSLNLAVLLQDPAGGVKLARVKVPDVLPRLVKTSRRRHEYVLLEDLIHRNLVHLFPGITILGAYKFRVIRDADIEIRELEAGDLIESIEETIRLRRFGDPVLLQVAHDTPDPVRLILLRLLKLEEDDCLRVQGLLGLGALWQLASIDKPNLRFAPYHPHAPESIATAQHLFSTVAKSDVLVHHPYDSFRSVEEFVAAAASDPQVIGIKQTLYRVGAQSPIVESLLEAAEAGKQVAVMVELKARFDETNNLQWARALERAGAHVTYGFAELKTHCKLCLIVRREAGHIRTYAHIGTGNYNPVTARQYTDVGLFTSDVAITQDVAELFNYLTGFSMQREYRRLLVAPINLRQGILDRIRRETLRGPKGLIIFKMNSLVDNEIIDTLYLAADAGVRIELIVRGVCSLRPRKGIRVLSIVGRFLEHSRVLYFENGGTPDVLIGSADLMRRNLDRRIEALVPVADPKLISYLRDVLLEAYLNDNVRAWELQESGTYVRKSAGKGKAFSAQEFFFGKPAAYSV